MTTPTTSPTAVLTEYLAGVPDRALPDAVRERVQFHLLDTLAAIVSGATLTPGVMAQKYARSQPGSPEASATGIGERTSALTAVVTNGMLAHSDETDDSHAAAFLHPGCSIVPAALAMAERNDASGEALLRAIAAGYDVGARVMRAAGRRKGGPRLFDTHAVGGALGSAAAAAAVARPDGGPFDALRWQYVLSYAAHQASGMPSYPLDTEHVEKAFIFGGMPARNGLTAALMVEAGFSGIPDDLEGFGGFLACFGSDDADPAKLAVGLGEHFEIVETNIKKFAVGSPCQAPVEALLRIIGREGITAAEVQHVDVGLSSAQERITRLDQTMPNLNLRYLLAVTLFDGELTFQACHDEERLRDETVLELARRMDIASRDDLVTAESPRQAIVDVTTRDGRVFTEHVVRTPGAKEAPLDRAGVIAKCRPLLELALSPVDADALIRTVLDLDDVTPARAIGDLLRRASVGVAPR